MEGVSESDGASEMERRRSRSDISEASAPAGAGPGPSARSSPSQEEAESAQQSAAEAESRSSLPVLAGRKRGRRLVKKELARPKKLSPQQRLLMLDTWQRSGLPAGEFASVVGISKHTLYKWK